MLYLITGANGAGKTLNTLKWVRERSVKESRPVCHNGRFEPVPGGELSSWKVCDFEKWQDEPDGTIFVIDECHNDMPLRPPSAVPPDHIKMLAEHRRRGFDFYLVTQHPQNIDAFVRRLIGSPGWHRHLKRTFGADLVSVLEWPAVNAQCEKNGSGKSGSVSMQAFPKDVFGWYKSASLHTGKKKIPKALWGLAASAVLVPAMLWGAYHSMAKHYGAGSVSGAPAATAPVAPGVPGAPVKTLLVDVVGDYVKARAPRFASLPHTAPIYDEITKPRSAPYPAACVHMGKVCKCYSQQATILNVDYSVCMQIVDKGFFVDWQEDHPRREVRGGMQLADASPGMSRPHNPPGSAPALDVDRQQAGTVPVRDVAQVVRKGTRSEWAQQLAARNASVHSVTEKQ